MHIHVCHDIHAEVRGQPVGIGFLLQPSSILGIEPGSSVLVVIAFTHSAILLTLASYFRLYDIHIYSLLLKWISV